MNTVFDMQKEKSLHIVSFDIPYPPSYGGVIDVYYKIKAFKDSGIKVHLHCFEYGRSHAKQLEELCESVKYYPRKTAKFQFLNPLPYIVVSRSSEKLLCNLLKDDYPILMEGLHSCFFINDKRFKNRKLIVRTHNIEHEYYANLAHVEKNFFKRMYFSNESQKLYRFEHSLNSATIIASISKHDKQYFGDLFKNVYHIPAFHPYEKIKVDTAKGNFALYHGNLSVGENNEAALYLVNKVFNDIDVPLIIAGSKPSADLVNSVKNRKNIKILQDIPTEEIHKLISDAQINILPTFQATGMKLKLLAVLFSGKHCIVNTPMVKETGVESLCHIADDAWEMKKLILDFFDKPFESEELEKRKKMLEDDFSNTKNIEGLIQLIFSHP